MANVKCSWTGYIYIYIYSLKALNHDWYSETVRATMTHGHGHGLWEMISLFNKQLKVVKYIEYYYISVSQNMRGFGQRVLHYLTCLCFNFVGP